VHSLSKKLRFEVFKRDSFTCQYCGQRAPAVILHCDHIKPRAEGGLTDILNLVTACEDCNLGKGARTLSENAVITKQLNQLTELQERREQMEMMLAWRDELDQLDEVPLLELEKRWNTLTEGQSILTYEGKKTLKKLVRQFGFNEIIDAMKTAVDQYLTKDDNGEFTFEGFENTFSYIGRIANVTHREQLEPGSRKMFYIRGILRNRLPYCSDWKALALIRNAARAGMPLELIEQAARETTSWSDFKAFLEDYVEQEQPSTWTSNRYDPNDAA
jgi:HNH endonuclease